MSSELNETSESDDSGFIIDEGCEHVEIINEIVDDLVSENEQLESKFETLCDQVQQGIGHFQFRVFIENKYYFLKSSIKHKINKLVSTNSELKDVSYVLAYLKYYRDTNSNRYNTSFNTYLFYPIQAGSVEAAIDSELKTWKTVELLADGILLKNKFPGNGYVLYCLADSMIPYRYSYVEYSLEHVNKAMEYLKEAVELGHKYAKYKLSYLYVKYIKDAKLGIRLYQEAEVEYGFRQYGEKFDLAYYWRHRTDSVIDFLSVISKYQEKIGELEELVETRDKEIVELKFRPGGPGYLEAKTHFELNQS